MSSIFNRRKSWTHVLLEGSDGQQIFERELMRMGLKSQDVNVIYPFIDPDFFRPIEKRIDEFPPSSESPNILSVGTICERKGQHHLVEAMKFVTREDPNARLLFVGRT